MLDTCPKCGSTNVCVGAFVLSCCECRWSYLNSNPCRICGGPSTSVVANSERSLYGCDAHPISDEETASVIHGFTRKISDEVEAIRAAFPTLDTSDWLKSTPVTEDELKEPWF